ncbi:MAG: RidA family protein [Balneolaceae bacterium]|nr:RidA family protein [Balneolaceae bacterium]MBO6544796.1 RidA family protein [Balneolaceae bacterium]MBO6646192.1 RidA family protein [Balneolaceae bacterium]
MKVSIFLLFLFCSVNLIAQERTPEQKLDELGIELPEITPPVANYIDVVQSGNLLFLAGKGSRNENGTRITGKVGVDLTIEEGYEAAKSIALQHLAVIKKEIGDLSKVVRVVKVLGMVNTDSGFTQHSQVINGYSDFMVEIFGEKGRHARSAVGMNSLPVNLAVEIEVIVEVEEN